MAAGITKTFSGSASDYVGGYGKFTLSVQFTMTETFDTATRKSDLHFSDFRIKAEDPMGNTTSYVGGTIRVTVNGTTTTVFSATASAGTYKVTANGSYNTVLTSGGAAWSCTLSGLSRDDAGKLNVAVSWDSITLNNYYSSFGISVSGGETTALTTIAASYALYISAGTGSAITAERTSSPNQGAFTGALSHGAVIYYGDVLKISFSADTGYELTEHTVNDAEFASGDTLTVSAAVYIDASATPKSYTLTVSSDGHAEVTVKRGSTALNSGDTISHFDVLTVTVSPKSGWKLSAADLNGTAIAADTSVSHTVSGDVTVTVTTEALSGLFIDDGGTKKRFMVLIDHEGTRKMFRMLVR